MVLMLPFWDDRMRCELTNRPLPSPALEHRPKHRPPVSEGLRLITEQIIPCLIRRIRFEVVGGPLMAHGQSLQSARLRVGEATSGHPLQTHQTIEVLTIEPATEARMREIRPTLLGFLGLRCRPCLLDVMWLDEGQPIPTDLRTEGTR